MSTSNTMPQRPSAFGAAAFKKAIDVVAHYVDFSDKSSSWSGSQSGDEGAETPANNEELRTPLLQSQRAASSDSPTTPKLHPHTPSDDSKVKADRQSPVSEQSQHPAQRDAETDLSPAVSEEPQSPAEMDVQRQKEDAYASSSSSDGAHTPTKEDLRAPLLPSQPVEQESHSQPSMSQEDISPPDTSQEDMSHAYKIETPSPMFAASSGLEKLGSGLLDPSLLQQLLDDHAPPPELPSSPIRHAEPVLAATNGHHDVEAAGQPESKSGSSGWVLTMFVMVAEMFGLGILTLPADFARLGWAIGLGLVLLFCLGTMYSGLLFAQLGAKVPNARVYEDFAAASLGKRGRWLVYCTVYLVIFLDPIIFHLTAAQSLQQIFYQKNMPLWVASVAVSVIMLPLSQLQDIGDVSLVSIIGTIGMLTSVVIATLKLLMMDVKGPRTHEAVHSDGFNVACVALMDIVFTFGGQQNWMRYIGGMRKKSDFKYSAAVGSVFMTTFYVILGGVGYWKLGVDFDHSKPITSVLPEDVWTSVMNVGLFAHCIIAYQIDLNVWTDLILDFTTRRNTTASKSLDSQKLAWLVTSCIGIAFAASMAYVLPFFSTIMGLIAAIGDLSAAYALPALFCLCLMRHEMPRWEQAVCYLLVPLSVLLSGFGIYASVYQLILQAARRV